MLMSVMSPMRIKAFSTVVMVALFVIVGRLCASERRNTAAHFISQKSMWHLAVVVGRRPTTPYTQHNRHDQQRQEQNLKQGNLCVQIYGDRHGRREAVRAGSDRPPWPA